LKKNQNSGGRFVATASKAQTKQPSRPKYDVNVLDWWCCLAGSSKTALRILIFSIALGAEYSFYVKSNATYAPQKVDIITHSRQCRFETY
jgi:hypothetical protein